MLRKSRKLTLYTILIAILAIVFLMIFSPTKTTSAQIEGKKSVKTVLVCEGDSLWSIAQDNYTELDGSLQEYMAEIRATNQMTSDAVRVGSYLVIPYYIIHE